LEFGRGRREVRPACLGARRLRRILLGMPCRVALRSRARVVGSFGRVGHRPNMGGLAWRGKGSGRAALEANLLEHDPEKWVPVFGKDHAPTRGYGAAGHRGAAIATVGVATASTIAAERWRAMQS